MDGPPPPPPPHGTSPKSSGLPPGNYDIFVIPPHSAGSGFLYLPSLQSQRNSFLAGVGCTLVAVLVLQIVTPVLREWLATIMATGGSGVVMLVVGVGIAGWAWGRSQAEPPAPDPGGRGFGGGDAGGGPEQSNRSPPNGGPGGHPRDNSGGATGATPGDTSGRTAGGPAGGPPGGAGARPKPTWQQRPNFGSTGPGTTGGGTPRGEWNSAGGGGTASGGTTGAGTGRGGWEKAREETRRKEEERRRREDEKRRQEEERKKKDEEDRKAKEAAEKERWERARTREREARERDVREKEAREREARERERKAREQEAREREARERESREREARDREAREREFREREARERESREREAREREAREREAREREAREREAREREAREREAREKREKEEKEKQDRERQEREKQEKERQEKQKQEREKREKERLERERREKEQLEKARQEKENDEKAKKGKITTTYAVTVGEKTNPYSRNPTVPVTPAFKAPDTPPPSNSTGKANGPTASSPTKVPPSPTRPSSSPTKRHQASTKSFLGPGDDAYSFRPYDRPKQHLRKESSHSSVYSESSYAPSQSTSRTSPPPSHRGTYSTKDPDKIVIRAVYSFNNAFIKLPTAQLISGVGSVTDGLILKMTTEGLFIDDDVRGVPQREWDIKAWTMKSVEVWCPHFWASGASSSSSTSATGSAGHHRNPVRRLFSDGKGTPPTSEETDLLLESLLRLCKSNCSVTSPRGTKGRDPNSSSQNGDYKGLHVLRASIRDQEGKKYLFVLEEEEGWKVAVGLQRLRRGTQVRAMGVGGIGKEETRAILENLGWD